MDIKKINPRLTVLLVFISFAGILRIVNVAEFTAFSNFTPLGAIALFGGAYFNKRWKAFAFPLLTLFAGDLIIYTFIYERRFEGSPLIYLSFAIIVLIGTRYIKQVTVSNIVVSSLLSALCFWLIADFSVWLSGGTDIRTQLPLSRNVAGLLQCYIQGFPFIINFLAGCLFYSAVMFGSFEWMQRKFPVLQTTLCNFNLR